MHPYSFLLVLFLKLALVATAPPKTISCARYFWPSVTPGDQHTIQGDCHFFQYPHKVGETHVSAIYNEGWRRLDNQEHLANIVKGPLRQSLTQSLELYGKYSGLPNDIVVILTSDESDLLAGTFYPTGLQSPCQIVTYRSWYGTDLYAPASADSGKAKQILAHELYHCVERHNLGLQPLNKYGAKWIIEGAADFFSNMVYPKANEEYLEDTSYDPKTPLYAQDQQHGIYGTNMFFQCLQQVRGVKYVSNFVMATEYTSGPTAERTRLSHHAGFTDDFFGFAQHYSRRSIKDTDGILIPQKFFNQIVATPKTIEMDNSGQLGSAYLETKPFTITTFELSLDAGQTIAMWASTKSYQRVAYRFSDTGIWQTMPTDPVSARKKPTKLKCNKDVSTISKIQVLFSSTADDETDEVGVHIHPLKKTKCCKINKRQDETTSCPIGGEGFILYPLQDPDNLNAVCPSGTHMSTLAVWCCPDGSNLDEARADEISLCCPGGSDCYRDIVPDNLKCADPDWVLWTKEYREIGCCMKGYVPTSSRYCVQDSSRLGAGFSSIAPGPLPTLSAKV